MTDGTAFTCVPCEKVFTGAEPFRLHMASAKHKRKMLAGSFVCEDCQMTFNGPSPLRDHMASERHAKKARLAQALELQASALPSGGGTGAGDSNTAGKDTVGCQWCNIPSFPTVEAACSHYESEAHRNRKKLLQRCDPDGTTTRAVGSVPPDPAEDQVIPETPPLPSSVLICRAEEDFEDFCKRNNVFS